MRSDRAATRHMFDILSLRVILNFVFSGPRGLDQRCLGIQRRSGEDEYIYEMVR